MDEERAPLGSEGQAGAKPSTRSSPPLEEAPPTSRGQQSRAPLLTDRAPGQDGEINQLRVLVEQLRLESTSSRDEYHRLQRDHAQIAAALRSEAARAVRDAAALRLQLDSANVQISDMTKDHSQRESAIKKEHDYAMQTANRRLAELQADLDALQQFRRDRDALEAEMQRSKSENQRLVVEYEEKLGTVHLRAHRLGQRIEQLEKEAAAEQEAAVGAADQGTADAFQLLQQNRKLAAALRRAGQGNVRLGEAAAKLNNDLVALRAELAIARGVEAAATESSAKQDERVSAAMGEIQRLKVALNDSRHGRDEALVVNKGLKRQVGEISGEVDRLRRQLQRQAVEVRHSRSVTRQLFEERSEVQAFLASSIRAVRREAAKESERLHRTAAQRPQEGGRTKFVYSGKRIPTTDGISGVLSVENSPGSVSSEAVTSASTCESTDSSTIAMAAVAGAAITIRDKLREENDQLADVSELNWVEREAILRLLLAQVNGHPVLSKAHKTFNVSPQGNILPQKGKGDGEMSREDIDSVAKADDGFRREEIQEERAPPTESAFP